MPFDTSRLAPLLSSLARSRASLSPVLNTGAVTSSLLASRSVICPSLHATLPQGLASLSVLVLGTRCVGTNLDVEL